MTADTKQPRARLALALGLFLAAIGVLTEFLVGVPGFPAIPPGPIILGVAGGTVLATPRLRWTLIAGLGAALFVTAGGLIEGSVWGRLADVGRFEEWTGAFLRWTGQLIARATMPDPVVTRRS